MATIALEAKSVVGTPLHKQCVYLVWKPVHIYMTGIDPSPCSEDLYSGEVFSCSLLPLWKHPVDVYGNNSILQ